MDEFELVSIGAGLAIGLSCLGSAIAQGMAGAAAAGATAENENLYVKALTFAILPETHSIFGFIIAMLLIALGAGIVKLG